MANDEAIRRKQKLLAMELQRYFGETCPEVIAKWDLAIIDLAPSLLRELAGRLQELEGISNRANVELRTA